LQEKKKDKPKRAMSAYIAFGQDKRGELAKSNPTLKLVDIARLLGQRWKELSAEEKQKYQQIAEKDKERAVQEKANYLAKHPKKPPTPYNLFIRKEYLAMKQKQPELSVTECFKLLAAKWSSLNPEQRKAYSNPL